MILTPRSKSLSGDYLQAHYIIPQITIHKGRLILSVHPLYLEPLPLLSLREIIVRVTFDRIKSEIKEKVEPCTLLPHYFSSQHHL